MLCRLTIREQIFKYNWHLFILPLFRNMFLFEFCKYHSYIFFIIFFSNLTKLHQKRLGILRLGTVLSVGTKSVKS